MDKKRYIVVMDFEKALIRVENFNGDVHDHCKVDDAEYGCYDVLPDFDESLMLDAENSSKSVAIFDFSKNKGIAIPVTDDQISHINDCIEQFKQLYGYPDDASWLLSYDDELYFCDL